METPDSTATCAVLWTELIAKLRVIFEADQVDVDEVKDLLARYTSNPSDWEAHAKFDPHRYTRNLVDTGNGKYNLIVLCWGEGHESCVHDHADSHCFMKMLGGVLKETQFHWPNEGDQNQPQLQEKATHTYDLDEVAYINDSIGIHRVENPSHTDKSVSLHLYSPPITCCNAFDERTGKSRRCTVTFYSQPSC